MMKKTHSHFSDHLRKLAFAALLFSFANLVGCGGTPTAPTSGDSATPATPLGALEQQQLQLAAKAISSEDLGKAKLLLEGIIEKKPGSAEAWANLALVYYRLQQYAAAADASQRALQYNPESAQLLNLQGLIQVAMGKIKDAEQSYLSAIDKNADFAFAHYNLALIYDIYYQEIGRALPHYEQYLNLLGDEDSVTAGWVAQLKRSLGGS